MLPNHDEEGHDDELEPAPDEAEDVPEDNDGLIRVLFFAACLEVPVQSSQAVPAEGATKERECSPLPNLQPQQVCHSSGSVTHDHTLIMCQTSDLLFVTTSGLRSTVCSNSPRRRLTSHTAWSHW